MSIDEPFKWERYDRRPGVWLRLNSEQWMILDAAADKRLDEIQEWCKIHNCGVRQSYDMWKFKDESEITMFLLMWS